MCWPRCDGIRNNFGSSQQHIALGSSSIAQAPTWPNFCVKIRWFSSHTTASPRLPLQWILAAGDPDVRFQHPYTRL